MKGINHTSLCNILLLFTISIFLNSCENLEIPSLPGNDSNNNDSPSEDSGGDTDSDLGDGGEIDGTPDDGSSRDPDEGGTSDPEETDETRYACYEGTEESGQVCLETVSASTTEDSDYEYKDSFGSDFPETLDPDQYRAPSRYIRIDDHDAHLHLSENFQLQEFMQSYKGEYGVYSSSTQNHLQNIRDLLGGSLIVNSGYRSPAYNEAIGGATWSRHTYGDAADLYTSHATLDELAELCELEGASYVSVYTNHVHCDWRDEELDLAFFDEIEEDGEFEEVDTVRSNSNARAEIIAESPTFGEETAFQAKMEPQEDPGELTIKWTLIDPNGVKTESDHRELRVSFSKAGTYYISVVLGGAISAERTFEIEE